MKRILLVISVILASCASAPPLPTITPTLPATPTHSATPTSTATVTPLPTLSPTPDPYYSWSIDYLRSRTYGGGQIEFLEVMAQNLYFTRYLMRFPSDGLNIYGFADIPNDEGPHPVIIALHGYIDPSIYDTLDYTTHYADAIASAGYVVLHPNLRGYAPSDQGDNLFRVGMAIVVLNLIALVQSQSGGTALLRTALPDRIGMWGHSMGGGVTLKALTVIGGLETSRGEQWDHPARLDIKAAVLYSTVSADTVDLINRWGMGCFGDILEGEQIIGCNSSDVISMDLPMNVQDAYRFAASDADTLKRISPINYLDQVTAPIQIHYGAEDGKTLAGTPPEWSVKLTQALRDEGKYAEMYQYEGEGHSFIGQPWFDFMIRTLRFFDRYLK